MTDKDSLAKATKKSKENETKRRDLEVKLNEVKAEMSTMKKLLRAWGECAATTHARMTATDGALEAQQRRLEASGQGVARRTRALGAMNGGVQAVAAKLKQLKETLKERDAEIARLNAKCAQYFKELKAAKEALEKLQTKLEEEVERASKPLREDLAATMGQLVRSRAERQSDRQQVREMTCGTSGDGLFTTQSNGRMRDGPARRPLAARPPAADHPLALPHARPGAARAQEGGGARGRRRARAAPRGHLVVRISPFNNYE